MMEKNFKELANWLYRYGDFRWGDFRRGSTVIIIKIMTNKNNSWFYK